MTHMSRAGSVVIIPTRRHSRVPSPRGSSRRCSTSVDAQAVAHVSLTGGSMGSAVLAAAARITRAHVDRLVARALLVERRALRAPRVTTSATRSRRATALLDDLDIPAGNIHPFAASDDGIDPGRSGRRLRGGARPSTASTGSSPVFDICFLGVGPDAHIASLFPDRSGILITDRTVVAVRDSPKPPPERVS